MKELLNDLAATVGGTIEHISEQLPDGSGFATMSMPLPKDHWLTAEGINIPPIPFRLGTDEPAQAVLPQIYSRKEFADKIRVAGMYAIRASTMNGKEIDFDPDAMLQNLVVGMLGYWTPNGLSSLDGDDETPRIKIEL